MLRIDRKQNVLSPMTTRSLADAGYLERAGLQKLICNSPDLFFRELGEELLLLGQEIQPAEIVGDRIDVLALDKQGMVVVIELKRGSTPFQHLQGIAYAAMISDWTAEELLQVFAETHHTTRDQAQEKIEGFLEVEMESVNARQRIILIAEGFDLEALATARWLARVAIDIRCYRLALSADGSDDVMSCACVFPLAQLEDHARIRAKNAAKGTPADWQSALEAVSNPAVRSFILSEVAAGAISNIGKRTVHYVLAGRRRFHVGARQERAYVWQGGRFDKDIEWWSQRLAPSGDVEPVDGGRSLRFYLVTADDFIAFKHAVNFDLAGMHFTDMPAEPTSEPE